MFLLQTFIHAAPAFASSVDHKKHYVPAYGEATVYGMLKKPPKAIGDVEEDHPSDGSIDDDGDLDGLRMNRLICKLTASKPIKKFEGGGFVFNPTFEMFPGSLIGAGNCKRISVTEL